MVETILLIAITLFTFGTANGESPSKELKEAHNLVSCIERDDDSMNAFHLAMLKMQETTKSKSKYHNLLTFMFATEEDSDVIKKLIPESGLNHIGKVIWMCRKEVNKR